MGSGFDNFVSGVSKVSGGFDKVASAANKIPVLGGMIEQGTPYAKKGILILAAYILITLCGIGPAIGITDLVLWIENGIFNSSSPTGIQCYSGYNSTPKEMIFKLSSAGVNVTGATPKTIDEAGQVSQWVNSGFVTTGAPLEIYVEGGWYPWGKEVVGKTLESVKIANNTDQGLADIDGGLIYDYGMAEVDLPCKTTTDISFFQDRLPLDTNGNKDYSQLGGLRQINHLKRYGSPNNSIDDEVEQIMDVHCLLNDTTKNGQTCANLRALNDRDFTPCYLNRGHGVYMKIGNVNYAYHLANHEVALYRKNINRNEVSYSQALDDTNTPQTMIVPFSLPTKTYNSFTAWNDPGHISWLSNNLVNVEGNIPEAGQPDLVIMQDAIACKNTDDPDAINETCPPAPNQPIFLIINDIYFTDNYGDVEVVFKAGAKKIINNNVFHDGSVFTEIAMYIFEPMFGKGSINYQNAGGSYSTATNISGKNVVSINKDGAVMQLRNMFLTSFTFQVFKILLLIIYIMFYGYGLIKGDTAISADDIAKRLLNIAFVIWATDSTNYEFVDNFLIPFFFGAFNDLAVAMVQTSLGYAGIDIVINDPFGAFDVMLSSMFSEVIGLKMIALFNANFLFFFSLLLIWILMIGMVILMVRTALVYVLSLFMIGFLFIISPLVCLMMLSDYTSHAFNSWKTALIKEGANSVVSMFFVSLFFALMLKPFNALFNFNICWDSLWSLDMILFKFSFYGWKISQVPSYSEFFLSLAGFAIMTVVLMQFKDKLLGIADTIFGASSLSSPSKGEDMLNNITGTLTGSSESGFGISPSGILRGAVNRIPGGGGKKLNDFADIVGGSIKGVVDNKNPLRAGLSLFNKVAQGGSSIVGSYFDKKAANLNKEKASNLRRMAAAEPDKNKREELLKEARKFENKVSDYLAKNPNNKLDDNATSQTNASDNNRGSPSDNANTGGNNRGNPSDNANTGGNNRGSPSDNANTGGNNRGNPSDNARAGNSNKDSVQTSLEGNSKEAAIETQREKIGLNKFLSNEGPTFIGAKDVDVSGADLSLSGAGSVIPTNDTPEATTKAETPADKYRANLEKNKK